MDQALWFFAVWEHCTSEYSLRILSRAKALQWSLHAFIAIAPMLTPFFYVLLRGMDGPALLLAGQ